MKKVKEIFPGLVVSVVVGIISILLGRFKPKLGAATIAIFLRMFVEIYSKSRLFQKGYKFSEMIYIIFIVLLVGTLSI